MKKTVLALPLIILSLTLFADDQIIIRAKKLSAEVFDYTITADEIKVEKPESVAEVLNDILSFNAVNKGFSLVQTDLYNNGGTFADVAILLDGVKINDIASATYTFDLPVAMSDIERIDVIKGGTTVFGSGGSTGLVNIVTNRYASDAVRASAEYGSYGTLLTNLTISKQLSDSTTMSGTVEKDVSNGFHSDTDYNVFTGYAKVDYLKDYEVTLGDDEKNFGAYDYNSPGLDYPSRQFIISKYADAKIFSSRDYGIDIYDRSHYDMFVLDNSNPEDTNRTNTQQYGATARYQLVFYNMFPVELKYNFQEEAIESSNEGNHFRDRNLATCNVYFESNKYSLGANMSFESYDSFRVFPEFMPSYSASYKLTDQLKCYAGYSYSKRYPDLTEMYYLDKVNAGSAGLGPERSSEGSGGIEVTTQRFTFNNGVFYRYTIGAIDWVATTITGSDGVERAGWEAENASNINTGGFSSEAMLDFDFMKLKAGYQFLESTYSNGIAYASKYGTNNLKDKATGESDIYFLNLTASVRYTFKYFINRPDYMSQCDVAITGPAGHWLSATLKVDDLFGQYFEEIKGIPAPGRMIEGRVDFSF